MPRPLEIIFPQQNTVQSEMPAERPPMATREIPAGDASRFIKYAMVENTFTSLILGAALTAALYINHRDIIANIKKYTRR